MEEYCVSRCPQGKICHVADPNLGCLIGSSLPNTRQCCQFDHNDYFIDRVFAIWRYGNGIDEINTRQFRRALGALLYSLRNRIRTVPRLDKRIHGVLVIRPNRFRPSTIDDLVQLMHKVVPGSGFKVIMGVSDIARQPAALRGNPRIVFKSIAPSANVPHNALTLAARLVVYISDQVTSSGVVALVLNTLRNLNPWPTAHIYVFLKAGCSPLISANQLDEIRYAMSASRFAGNIEINSLSRLFANDVQMESMNISPQRSVTFLDTKLQIAIAG